MDNCGMKYEKLSFKISHKNTNDTRMNYKLLCNSLTFVSLLNYKSNGLVARYSQNSKRNYFEGFIM